MYDESYITTVCTVTFGTLTQCLAYEYTYLYTTLRRPPKRFYISTK